MPFQEKIARSLVNQEQALAASYYGKFFARNLNLYLLQRRPEDWRNLQSERKRAQDQEKLQTAAPPPAKHEPAPQPESRKRKSHPENEIDALFNEKLGKRIKKAALSESAGTTDVSFDAHPVKKEKNGDKDLQQVLGAIRSAPANDGKKKKKH
jgi:nucleolar protein 9